MHDAETERTKTCPTCEGQKSILCRRCGGSGLVKPETFIFSLPDWLRRFPEKCPQCSSTTPYWPGIMMAIPAWFYLATLGKPTVVRGNGREICPTCKGSGAVSAD